MNETKISNMKDQRPFDLLWALFNAFTMAAKLHQYLCSGQATQDNGYAMNTFTRWEQVKQKRVD